MNGGNGKILIAIVVVLIAIAAVLVLGWGKGGATTSTTPGAKPGTTAAKPADLVPKTLAGFDVANQDMNYKSTFAGEEAAAVTSFKPAAGSKYLNKVEHLTVYVHLFKDSKSAATVATALAAGTSAVERDVSGVKYKLNSKSTGEIILYSQKGNYLAYAFVKPTATAGFADTAVIQDAVILGFSAVKLP